MTLADSGTLRLIFVIELQKNVILAVARSDTKLGDDFEIIEHTLLASPSRMYWLWCGFGALQNSEKRIGSNLLE